MEAVRNTHAELDGRHRFVPGIGGVEHDDLAAVGGSVVDAGQQPTGTARLVARWREDGFSGHPAGAELVCA